MNLVFYVIAVVLELIIDAELLLMFVRAVLSWIMPDAEGGILDLIYFLTEPIIQPVRAVLYRFFPSLQDFPIDVSFFVTTVLLGLIGLLISI